MGCASSSKPEGVKGPSAVEFSAKEVAGTYSASASNGDWGDYDIEIEISDAKSKVKITRCDFRDSPSQQWEYEGACSFSGDLLTFTPFDEKKAAEDKENAFPMKFKIQGDGALAKIKEDGTVDMIQGGYDGKPVPAILKKKA
ncbi:unnamed protein product [Effrenium voratum]|nr:unnamed protein product [Effrenium voratum]